MERPGLIQFSQNFRDRPEPLTVPETETFIVYDFGEW
jgi:hypothetical protein